MSDSEFFKIVPMELQEKAIGRANLVESLSRRSSIYPGQTLFPPELSLSGALAGVAGVDDISEEAEEHDVDQENNVPAIPFPYGIVTNENLRNIRNRLGIIDLSFAQVDKDQFLDKYPVNYFTWTEKEQLLLVFAENFRRQFNDLYKLRRPLLLAPRNECGIQVNSRLNP